MELDQAAAAVPFLTVLPLTHVTVHPGMARVERSGPLPPEALKGPLILKNLPPLLLEASIQVRIEGCPLEVSTIQPGWEVPLASASSLGEAQQRVKALGRDVQRLELQQEGLERSIQYWSSLTPEMVSLQGLPLPGAADPIPDLLPSDDAWSSILERVEQALGTRQEALRACLLALKQAREQHRIAAHALQRLEAGRTPGTPCRTLTLQLAVSDSAATSSLPEGARLWVSYRVPGATWVPVYEVRTDLSGQESSLSVKAMVAQATGEDWEGVALAVSTAAGGYSTELPVLPSLRIGRRQNAPARTGYRPPPGGLGVLFEGYDRHRPADAAPKKLKTAKPRSKPRVMPVEEVMEASFPEQEELSASWAGVAHREHRAMSHEMPSLSAFGSPPGAPPPPMQVAAASMPPMPMAAAASMPPMLGGMPPSPKRSGAPQASRSRVMAPKLDEASDGEYQKKSKEAREEGGGGGFLPPEPAPAGVDAAAQWLEFDGLRLPGPDAPGRGELMSLSQTEQLEEALPEALSRDSVDGFLEQRWGKARAIESLSLPPLALPVAQSKGRFDHLMEADTPLDVPSDGVFHSVRIRVASGRAELSYRCVPGVESAVYRELVLKNPLASPLLTGPCDLYMGSELVATSALERVDVGGTLKLGLGVEERIKVARNVVYKESATGLLSGSLNLDHEIHLSFSSQIEQPVTVEVVERIPTALRSEVEVKELTAQPPAKPYDQAERGAVVRGGRRLLVSVPARGQAKASLAWRAVISNKLELVGGNRRE